ncbi:MAG: hypothetical protein RIQ97_1489 [Pseudomonadota bacterium]|jgi:hypothetical protein
MNPSQPLLDLALPLRRPSRWHWFCAGALLGGLGSVQALQHLQANWAAQASSDQQARALRQALGQPAPGHEPPAQQAMLARILAHQAASVRLQDAFLALAPSLSQTLVWRLSDGRWELQGGLMQGDQAQALMAELQTHSGQPWRLVRLSQPGPTPDAAPVAIAAQGPHQAARDGPAAPWQWVAQSAMPALMPERLEAKGAPAPPSVPATRGAP